MADTTLNTTSGTGNQATTQSPQVAGSSGTTGAKASSVQPGTASDLLRSQQGIQLKDTPVTTVNLSEATSSGTVQQTPATKHHHINPALGAFSIALFVLAIVLFWITSRTAKSTTD